MRASIETLGPAMMITALFGSTAVAKPVPSSEKAPACLGVSSDGVCAASKTTRRAAKNVEGAALAVCSTEPMTGFFRDGRCRTGPSDRGVHVVCAQMTKAFLAFTRRQGNDLSTPAPQYGFTGLEPGDRWCLCAARWQEAYMAGTAPPVILDATHAKATDIVAPETLRTAVLHSASESSAP